MGSTKVKIIDDSVSEKSELKKKKTKKSEGVVAKVDASAGVPEERSQASTAVERSVRSVDEDAPEIPKGQDPQKDAEPKAIRTVKTGHTKLKSKPKHGKKYLEKSKLIDRSKKYILNEAIDLAKQTSYSKFDGTLELHINTNLKNIRGSVTLPNASGRRLDVLASGKTEYNTEPNAMVIHLGVGKVSQSTEEIEANIKTLYQIIGKSKITKLTLSPTMGIGVKIDPSTI